MDASSLIEAVRRHLGGGEAPEPGALRRALVARLTDRRKRRGIRHELAPVVSVLVAGAACGYRGPLAIAEAAAGWDQELLAAHGCRVSPATGLRVAPSARTLYRVPEGLDADELEAALTAALADAALDPQVTAAAAAKRQKELGKKEKKRKPKPPAAGSFRQEREDGWFRPHPLHPWLDPAVTGDPGHVPARHAVAVDGKERKGAKAGGNKKVHLLAAVTHTPGIVIAQDKVAKSGKANEISHFRPLLAPLPLDGDRRYQRRDAGEPGQRPVPSEGEEGALPVAHPGQPADPERDAERPALAGHARRRRDLRDHPGPDRDPDPPRPALPRGHRLQGAEQALLIERYVTYKNKGQWHTRAEAVLYLTSLAEDETTPEDLLAHVRGHWRVEHAHWLRDVIWKEDKSLIRTGNAPQVWSAIANLVISLFRIHGVTSYTAETRRCAQDPRRALQILDLTALSPG